MSRTINQIMIAVQENDPNLTNEELRLCVESLRVMLRFVEHTNSKLIEAIDSGGKSLGLRSLFAKQERESLFQARKKSPAEWLGPNNIPGSPEQVKQLAWAKRVYEKATGETL